MKNIKEIIRPNILDLEAYSSARDEYSGKGNIFLDANENPFGKRNRYPDPYQKELKDKLGALKNINTQNIFLGNGSDEVIDLAFRTFCNPGVDKALTFSPTYGIYAVSASINDVELIEVPLNKDFQIDIKLLDPHLEDENIKLVFICSPNNPTGNLIDVSAIIFILENFEGVVIIDEAYIDFAKVPSLIPLIQKYKNLIICQTFSKAWGLAAVRVGVAYTDKQVVSIFNKVKPPYNISAPNQKETLKALSNVSEFEQNLFTILQEKSRLESELDKIEFIKGVYPSDANFLLAQVSDATELYKRLISHKIIIRNRTKQVLNCIRISVGTPQENDTLINVLKNME